MAQTPPRVRSVSAVSHLVAHQPSFTPVPAEGPPRTPTTAASAGSRGTSSSSPLLSPRPWEVRIRVLELERDGMAKALQAAESTVKRLYSSGLPADTTSSSDAVRVAKLRGELVVTQQRLDTSQSEGERLRDELARATEFATHERSQRAADKNTVRSLGQRVESLLEQLQQTSQELGALKVSSQSEVHRLENSLQDLRSNHSAATQKNETLEREVKSLRQKLRDALSEKSRMTDDLEHLTTSSSDSVASLRLQIRKKDESIKSLSDEVTTLTSTTNSLRSELSTAETSSKRLTSERDELQSQLLSLQEHQAAVEKEQYQLHSSREKRLQSLLTSTQTELQAATSKLRDIKLDLQSQREEVERLTSRVRSAEAGRDTIRQQLVSTGHQHTSAQQEWATEKTSMVQALSHAREATREMEATLMQERREMDERVALLTEHHQRDINAERSNFAQLRATMTVLQAERASGHGEAASTANAVQAELQRQLADAKSQLDTAKRRSQNAEDRLVENERMLQSFQSQLREATQRCEEVGREKAEALRKLETAAIDADAARRRAERDAADALDSLRAQLHRQHRRDMAEVRDELEKEYDHRLVVVKREAIQDSESQMQLQLRAHEAREVPTARQASTIMSLEAQCARYLEDITQLRSQLQAIQDRERLEEEQREAAGSRMKMDVARLEQEVLHARREASDHEEVVTELRQKLLDTARERDDCIRSKAELVSQLDQERARATSLSLELQQAQAVFSDTSPMRPSRLTLESETLPARAQATKSQLARLRLELTSAEEELRRRTEELAAMSDRVSQHRSREQSLEEELDAALADARRSHADNRRLETRITEHEEALSRANARVQELEATRRAVEAGHHRNVSLMEEEAMRMEHKLKAVQTALHTQAADSQRHDTELESLRLAVFEANKKQDQLRAEVTRVTTERDDARHHGKRLQEELSRLKRQVAHIEALGAEQARKAEREAKRATEAQNRVLRVSKEADRLHHRIDLLRSRPPSSPPPPPSPKSKSRSTPSTRLSSAWSVPPSPTRRSRFGSPSSIFSSSSDVTPPRRTRSPLGRTGRRTSESPSRQPAPHTLSAALLKDQIRKTREAMAKRGGSW